MTQDTGTGEEASHASDYFEQRFSWFFEEKNNPALRVGYVSDECQATEAEIERAKARYEERLAETFWRPLDAVPGLRVALERVISAFGSASASDQGRNDVGRKVEQELERRAAFRAANPGLVPPAEIASRLSDGDLKEAISAAQTPRPPSAPTALGRLASQMSQPRIWRPHIEAVFSEQGVSEKTKAETLANLSPADRESMTLPAPCDVLVKPLPFYQRDGQTVGWLLNIGAEKPHRALFILPADPSTVDPVVTGKDDGPAVIEIPDDFSAENGDVFEVEFEQLWHGRLAERLVERGVVAEIAEFKRDEEQAGFHDSSVFGFFSDLDGTSPPIHQTNFMCGELGWLRIDETTVEDYIDFFCIHVQGQGDGFYPVERGAPLTEQRMRELGVTAQYEAISKIYVCATDTTVNPMLGRWIDQKRTTLAPDRHLRSDSHSIVAEVPHPIIRLDRTSEDGYVQAIVTVVYSNVAFRTHFSVQPTGMIEMTDDNPLNGIALSIHQSGWTPPDFVASNSDRTAE